MQKTFFTSKEAAQITGCTLRQLQYWREKEVVVPTVNATGTGRSVYYSRGELVELATMAYWLSVGLSFEMAREALFTLREKEPDLFTAEQSKRLMLLCESDASLRISEFDMETVMMAWESSRCVVPVWFDVIWSRLHQNLF
jgi:DNA-binding transcriptional MerR regulator